MYRENLFSKLFFTKSLKKKFAILYSNNAPMLIESKEIENPIHFPKNIPDSNKSGDPKPKSIIHIIEKIKKYNRFNKKLIPTNCSIINCSSL